MRKKAFGVTRHVKFHGIAAAQETMQMCSIDRRDFAYFASKTFTLGLTKGFKRVRCPNPCAA